MTVAPEDLTGYRSDLARAFKLLDDSADRYALAKEYYDGTRAEVSASKAVRKLIQANAEASPVSLAHIPVDVLADKITLAGLTATEAAAAAVLTTVADLNDLDDEFDDWVRKACYFGDYYAVIDPTLEDGTGRVTADGIRLIGSSPLSTVVVYHAQDGRTPLYGVKRWKDGARWRALLYYDDVTVRLVTPPKSAVIAEKFELDLVDGAFGSERIAHDGDAMLVKHLAVDGKPYGRPVHARAYGPQDAITKISAVNLANVDGQGFAARWAIADPMTEIDDDIDDDFGTDGPNTVTGKRDGQTDATTGTSRVRSVPGAIAMLRGVKQVGQFDATGSDDFLKNLDWYVRVMAVACGVALFEFDMTGEQPSGESRRRAEGRSNRHAAKIQRSAGAFARDIGDTVLGLTGIAGTVSATFYPLETSTDKDGLELVGLKITNGVPVPQALREAGYTDEQVDEWYPDDAPHVTPALLTVLASALQSLGQAKTLGVITDDELRDMLPTILTGARGEGVIDSVDDDAGELAVDALVAAGMNEDEARATLNR